MTTPQDEPLKPTEFSPQSAAVPDSAAAPDPRPAWLLPALGVAVLVAAFVFLVLPSLVDTTPSPPGLAQEIPRRDGATEVGNSPAPAQSAAEEEASPFADAQMQKQRRAAQEALQEVLALQDQLVELGVETWAPEDYANALTEAEAGDTAYRERDFATALSAYQAAGTALGQLEASIPDRLLALIDRARSQIEAGDEAGARATVATLALLSPGDPEIAALEARIAAIPAVMAALEAAEEAADARDYDTAVASAGDALAADPEHVLAAQQLQTYRDLATDAAFRRAMSDGYLALESQAFDTAESAFKRAATLRAGAPEPQAALGELATARTAYRLLTLKSKGAAQEAAETWQVAVETYEAALSIDASVLFAQQGLERAKPRAELAEAIAEVLKEPERLVDARIFAEAEETLQRARETPEPGPVLTEQIAEMESALTYARTPVNVAFTSDTLTDVTVLRVKRLGAFSDTSLVLRPGSYTAMGVRNGYRDVRVAFEVAPDSSNTVDVRCAEAI